jgi:hypothetical protein
LGGEREAAGAAVAVMLERTRDIECSLEIDLKLFGAAMVADGGCEQ